MIKEYRNWANEKITSQQLENIESYKEIIINPSTNIIKEEKRFEKNILENISYYKDTNENESQIIDNLRSQSNHFCIKRRENYGIYTIVYSKEYRSSDLYLTSCKLLYDFSKSNNYICIQNIDNITELPIELEETEKIYWTDDESWGWGKKELLNCVYRVDGSLELITYMPNDNEQDWEYFDASNFNVLQSYFTDDISYYLNADFLP